MSGSFKESKYDGYERIKNLKIANMKDHKHVWPHLL